MRALWDFRRTIEDRHDIVWQMDTDELLFQDPATPLALPKRAAFALGLNLFPSGGRFSGQYSKAVATWGSSKLRRHGVQLEGWKSYRPEVVPGLFLVHTKYSDAEALRTANETRREIARGSEGGLPGLVWRHAEATAARHIATTSNLPLGRWDAEVARLTLLLKTRYRTLPNSRSILPPHYQSGVRVTPPSWIRLPSSCTSGIAPHSSGSGPSSGYRAGETTRLNERACP